MIPTGIFWGTSQCMWKQWDQKDVTPEAPPTYLGQVMLGPG